MFRETCRMLVRITSSELVGIDRVSEAFRVTPAVTKVDSLLRVASGRRRSKKEPGPDLSEKWPSCVRPSTQKGSLLKGGSRRGS